jgi:putative FmdB family regulatory protein
VLNWESAILLELFDGELDVPTYQYRCRECGKSFERTETISEHDAAKVRCPKCNSKKVTQVPGRVHVVTSKKS